MTRFGNILFILWAVFFCRSVCAQERPVLASLCLERIYAGLPEQCRQAIGRQSAECTLPAVNRPLYVQRNARKEITGMGLRMFPEQYAGIYVPEILAFLERTALELLLQPNNQRIAARLKEYRMSWVYNDNHLDEGLFRSFASSLDAVTDTSDFRLLYDSLTYTAQWTHPARGVLVVSFPAQYSVIAGKDSKELGDELSEILSAFKTDGTPETGSSAGTVKDTDALAPYHDKVYVNRGKSFIIPGINSDIYYQREADTYKLLYSRSYQCETLANLFGSAGMPNQSVMLDITHRKYGYTEQKYHISLADFVAFFNKDFETYIGFETAKLPGIKAVVILYNRKFNYVNMLLVDTFENAFFAGGSDIRCRMYAYIPTHNIRSLFGSDITSSDKSEYESILFE